MNRIVLGTHRLDLFDWETAEFRSRTPEPILSLGHQYEDAALDLYFNPRDYGKPNVRVHYPVLSKGPILSFLEPNILVVGVSNLLYLLDLEDGDLVKKIDMESDVLRLSQSPREITVYTQNQRFQIDQNGVTRATPENPNSA